MPRPWILVVDDDAFVRDFVETALRMDGYIIDTATNGREALTLIEQRRYDLVVSNMGMPELDGPGLYLELKERRPDLALPFLFLTGDYEKPDYASFFAESGVPALAKPCSAVLLSETVKHILGTG